MAGMSLATTAFAKAAIGSTEIQKISIGTTEIWSAAPPPTVDFDAVSSMQGGLGDLSYSFSAAAGSRVFVVTHLLGNETVAGVTYGGNAMSLVQGIAFNNTSSSGWLRVYTLASAPGGSQTVVMDKNGGNWCMSYTISYANVASLGTPATATGSSTSPSHSVSAPPTNGRTFQVTGWNNGNVSFTPSGGTGRINGTQVAGGLTGRDSNAAATHSGTLSSSCPWASIAVPMNPVT